MHTTRLESKTNPLKTAKIVLILTSSGGSGHIQAANAKTQEIESLYPHIKIVRRDLLTDFMGKKFGTFCANFWNSAQTRGSMIRIAFIVSTLRIFQKIAAIPVFFSILHCCLKEEIDYIINTQPNCTGTILKALRLIHFWKKKKIEMELVFTDLPTKEATHFFHPIKRLSKRDRSFLKIITTTPLLDENESEESFWQDYCSASQEDITYTRLPVRASFLKYIDEEKTVRPLTLHFKMTSKGEVSLIQKIAHFGNFPIEPLESEFVCTIQPEDKIAIIMLGAYPHREAILDYCKEFIEVIQKRNYRTRRDILFVLTGDHSKQKDSLQEKILDLLKKTENYPRSLTIIPITQQGESIIASLFHRSDATFTRSGGLTSMELLCVSRGKIWIHKGKPPENTPSFFLNRKSFQGGMPPWEKGNANYLEAKKGAHLVSPDTFKEVCQSYFPEEQKFDVENNLT